MTPTYNESLSPDQNLEYLADSLEQQIRNLASLPSRAGEIESLTLGRRPPARVTSFTTPAQSAAVTRRFRSGGPDVPPWGELWTRRVLAGRRSGQTRAHQSPKELDQCPEPATQPRAKQVPPPSRTARPRSHRKAIGPRSRSKRTSPTCRPTRTTKRNDRCLVQMKSIAL